MRLVGLAVSRGAFPQTHGTGIELSPDAEKMRIAAVGQAILGTEIVIFAGWPGDRVRLDGVNFIPFIPIPDTDQFRSPSEPGTSTSVPVQVQPEFAV